MLKKALLIVAAVLMVTVASSCKKSEPAPAEPAQVEITEENLDTELEKMEAEIEADIAAGQ